MSVSADGLLVLSCAGVPITACTPARAVQEVIRLATSNLDRPMDVHLCNAYTLALADRHPAFKLMLRQAAINFPDGKSVVWINRWLYRDREVPCDRVYGPDLFLDVFAAGQKLNIRHYLLGSTPKVMGKLDAELRRRFPDAKIVGVDCPPFRVLTDAEKARQTARIVDSRAQVVWVGLGTPKQDWESSSLSRQLPAVFVAVGAAFDFVAGEKTQAPKWIQNAGLEWLFRFGLEPRRLWKRYLFGNIQFLNAVASNGKHEESGPGVGLETTKKRSFLRYRKGR